MSGFFTITPTVHQYMMDNSSREHPLLKALREEIAPRNLPDMCLAPEAAQLVALLVSLISARRILEIGTFIGYSTLSMAMVLPEDGKIIACDSSKPWTDLAQEYWKKAGVADKIELRLGLAMDSLTALLEDENQQPFDLVFIDADKLNYLEYYEKTLALLRPGGLIVIDNVLRQGTVADPLVTDKGTEVTRQLNQRIFEDERVLISLVPIADGLFLAQKKA
jgi:predicted O-methyltransferase YrrM